MIERGAISDPTTAPNGETPDDPTANRPVALEQRVARLEDAVATLQDTRPLEERVVERVSRRLHRESTPALPEAGGVLKAGRQLLPVALNLIRTKADEAERSATVSPGGLRRPWLLFDAYAEVQTIVRMFLDRRYRPTWTARLVPLAFLVLIMTSSWIWMPGTGIVFFGTILDKIVTLVLAYLAFKILHREVRRYRELVGDLPLVPRS